MAEQQFEPPSGPEPGITGQPSGMYGQAPETPAAPPFLAPPAQVPPAQWQQTPAAWLTAPTAPHARAGRGRVLLTTAVVVGLAAAFGAGLATGRATAPKTAGASAGVAGGVSLAGVTAGSAGPTATSAAPVTAGGGSTVTARQLVGALLPLPAGAKALPVPGANADGSMDLDQYLQLLYKGSASEKSALQARSFEGASARWMDTAQGQEDCFYLIAFGSADGAQSYALALAKAHDDDPNHAKDVKFPVSALTDGAGFEVSTLDSYGNADSDVYGSVGNVTVIVHSYTPAALNRAEMLGLLGKQAAHVSSIEGSAQ